MSLVFQAERKNALRRAQNYAVAGLFCSTLIIPLPAIAVTNPISTVTATLNGALGCGAGSVVGSALQAVAGQGLTSLATITGLQSTLLSNINGLSSMVNSLGTIGSPTNIAALNALGNAAGISNAGATLSTLMNNVNGSNLTGTLSTLSSNANTLLANINSDYANISNLSQAQLNNLQTMVGNLTNLNSVVSNLSSSLGTTGLTSSINNLLNLANNPAGINISALTNQLNQFSTLSSQLGSLSSVGNLLGSLNGQISTLANLGGLANLTNLGNITGLGNIISQLGNIQGLLGNAVSQFAKAVPVNCGLVNGKHLQDTPSIACSGGTCPVDGLDNIAQLVAAGCDPPVTLRKELGTAIRAVSGSTTPSGFCAPGVNGVPGAPLCPTYNINGNPNAIANNGAGPSAFSTGNAAGILPCAASNILNSALNKSATPVQQGQTSIPAMACGGAVELPAQQITLGGIGIGTVPASATTAATETINNTVGIGTCVGSTFTLPANVASLILAPTTTTTAITNGTVTPPAGSIISVPAGTAVTLSVSEAGSMLLPDGGTIVGPDGTSISIAQGGTLTSLGGGSIQVSIPGGATTTYVYSLPTTGAASPYVNTNGSINVTTTEVGVPANSQLPLNPNASVISPSATTSTGYTGLFQTK